MTQQPPSLEAFLELSDDAVAEVAPTTLVYASSGTRRRAALEGVELNNDAYMRWTRPRFVATIARLFRAGARHVIVPTLGPRQLAETGVYRDRLVGWTSAFMAGPEMCADYVSRGWRVRFMHTPAAFPELQHAASTLIQSTPSNAQHTLWCYVIADEQDPWQDIIQAAKRASPTTAAELRVALYGEAIPPATLLIGGGQLVIRAGMLPPALLSPDLHLYWTQRAGFELTDGMIRRIWYDYAYGRQTWQANRMSRYQSLEQNRALWDTTAVIGVGQQRDGFWYPEAFPGVDPFLPSSQSEINADG